MKKHIFYLLCLMLALCIMPALAQEAAAPTPEAVEVEATDGLALKGDLYRPATIPEEGAPTLLLMHQYQSSRHGYATVIPQFVEEGYIVLVVDLRGHGETGGKNDWVAAQADTQTWLAWLREQEGVRDNAIGIIGASIGSNLALVGCAHDELCVTAIALSPGLDYFGVKPQESLVDGLFDRSALLIAGSRDRESADAIRSMFVAARGKVAAEMLPSSTHGTAFFANTRDREAMMGLILAWLDQEFAVIKD
jgi:pimeloyl-ACP methyl ester carboxylesterase